MRSTGFKKGISFALACVLTLSMGMFSTVFAAETTPDASKSTSGTTTTSGAVTTTPGATTTTPGATTPGATIPATPLTSASAVTPGAVTPGAVTPGAVTPAGFVFDATKGVSQFADAKDHYSATYVDALIKNGGISGYKDGTYKPDQSVTTAEMLSILLGSVKQPVTSDGAVGTWAEKVMQRAYELKIVTETEFPKSEGDVALTREKMSMLLVRVCEVLLKEEKVVAENPADYIRDYATVSTDMQSYVAQAFMKGFVTGDNGSNFSPKGNATRGDAAIIATRIIDKTMRATPKAFTK